MLWVISSAGENWSAVIMPVMVSDGMHTFKLARRELGLEEHE